MITKNKIDLLSISGVDKIGANSIGFAFHKCYDILFIVDYGIDIESPNYITPYNISFPDLTRIMLDYQRIVIIITHAHEDHVGGFNLFKVLKNKKKELYHRIVQKTEILVATEFNMNLINAKYLEKDNIELNFKIVGYNHCYEYAESNTQIKFYRSDHSIPDSSFVELTMNGNRIVFTGDWTIYYPHRKDKEFISNTHNTIRALRQKEIDILVCESTRIDTYKHRMNNEEEVVENIGYLIDRHDKPNNKIIIMMFSTNLERVIGIAEYCIAKNINLHYVGHSFDVMLKVAYKSGLIPDKIMGYIKHTKAEKIDSLEGVFICTGAQIEHGSCVYKLLYDHSLSTKLDEKYVFVFSTGIIPANSAFIEDALSIITSKNCTFYHGNLDPIHISGHASYSQMEFLYKELKAKLYLTMHGDCIKTRLNSRLISLCTRSNNSRALRTKTIYEINFAKNAEIKQSGGINTATFVKIDRFGEFCDKRDNSVEEKRKLIMAGSVVIFTKQNKTYVRCIGTALSGKTINEIKIAVNKNEEHEARHMIKRILRNYIGHIEILI